RRRACCAARTQRNATVEPNRIGDTQDLNAEPLSGQDLDQFSALTARLGNRPLAEQCTSYRLSGDQVVCVSAAAGRGRGDAGHGDDAGDVFAGKGKTRATDIVVGAAADEVVDAVAARDFGVDS